MACRPCPDWGVTQTAMRQTSEAVNTGRQWGRQAPGSLAEATEPGPELRACGSGGGGESGRGEAAPGLAGMAVSGHGLAVPAPSWLGGLASTQ